MVRCTGRRISHKIHSRRGTSWQGTALADSDSNFDGSTVCIVFGILRKINWSLSFSAHFAIFGISPESASALGSAPFSSCPSPHKPEIEQWVSNFRFFGEISCSIHEKTAQNSTEKPKPSKPIPSSRLVKSLFPTCGRCLRISATNLQPLSATLSNTKRQNPIFELFLRLKISSAKAD